MAMAMAMAVAGCRAKERPAEGAPAEATNEATNAPTAERAAERPAEPSPASRPPPASLKIVRDETSARPGDLSRRALEVLRDGSPMTVWIYRRADLAAKAPVILIGAAGTPLIFGIGLGEGDEPEHLPWARHGYVVVAYSLDGEVVNREEASEIMRGVGAFFRAHAGLSNARAALQLALAEEPLADAARVFAVGHSSAATLALRVGAELPEVKGIVAFSGVSDVEARVAELRQLIEAVAPHAMPRLRQSSPLQHLPQLRRKPLFLFHAEDDRVVPVAETRRLAELLAPLAPPSEVMIVPTGDHYDSMLRQGVPAATLWLDELAQPAK